MSYVFRTAVNVLICVMMVCLSSSIAFATNVHGHVIQSEAAFTEGLF